MFDRAGLLYIVQNSGLSKTEIGILYGVSRQTIYNWMGEGEPTQSFIVNHAAATTKGIKQAIVKELLPFPKSLTPRQRKIRLNTMVRQLHDLAKPASIQTK